MSNVTEIEKWRKKTLRTKLTLPASKEVIEQEAEKKDFLREAVELYSSLLYAYNNGYNVKKLDAAMQLISTLDLHFENDVCGTTKYSATYRITLSWKHVKRIEEMMLLSGATSENELLSRAMFVLWEAVEHIKLDGYILVGKLGEAPGTVSERFL